MEFCFLNVNVDKMKSVQLVNLLYPREPDHLVCFLFLSHKPAIDDRKHHLTSLALFLYLWGGMEIV